MNETMYCWRRDAHQDELMLVVLYDKPLDAPTQAVLRAQYSSKRGVRSHAVGLSFDSLEQAYEFMGINASDLVLMPRAEADEPQIVCSWL